MPHQRIRTAVTNGVVTLEGTVESWNQSVDAVRAVCNLPGVQAVKNALVVALRHLTPAVVRVALESALEREAALAASRNVEVAVTDGRVVMRGVIPSWAAVERLLAAVWAIPGVVEVENHLEKQP